MSAILELFKEENAFQILSIIGLLLSSIVLPLISVLINAINFIIKKFNNLVEIRKEKTVKFSAMDAIIGKRLIFAIWQPVIFLVILFFFLIVITIFKNTLLASIVYKMDPNLVFVLLLIISYIFSEYISYARRNRKDFINNLYWENRKIRYRNYIIFYLPSLTIFTTFTLLILYENHSNFISTLTAIFFIVFIFLFCTLYFNLLASYPKYSVAIIIFNNAYPNITCLTENLIIDSTGFVTVKCNEGQNDIYTKYNSSIIKRIDYIKDDNIDKKYDECLKKRGFIN